MKISFLILGLLITNAFAIISIKNGKLVDQQDRQIRIHGTNVVVKVPPYLPRLDRYDPEWSFSEQDMRNLTKWGLNGIRLGMMWAGVEPQKDAYNLTYLNMMDRLINMAGKHGIYTLIDFHQDLIAEKFCGDGIPTWLINQLKLYRTFPFPLGKKIKLNESGLPSWDKCDQSGWGKYYFSYDVGDTFNELYKIGSKLNKKFTDFWITVVKKFKDNPYVIGYELINEPFVGNAVRDITLMIPSVAEKVKFQNFYDNLTVQIRKIDPNKLIFFEPVTFDNTIPSGFSHPPGGYRFKDKSVFAYHYQHPPSISLNTIKSRVKDGIRLGVPSFLTQHAICDYQIYEITMKYKQSWFYWIYKPFGKNWGSKLDKGFENYHCDNKGEVMNENRTMTYLHRIAGQLIQQNFNFKNKHYTAHYFAKPSGKSLLYYCEYFNYKKGHTIEGVPKHQVKFEQIRLGYYEITYSGEEAKIIQISLDPI